LECKEVPIGMIQINALLRVRSRNVYK